MYAKRAFQSLIGLALIMGLLGEVEWAGGANSFCLDDSREGSKATRPGYHDIKLPVDVREVKEIQRAFEEGHQPWRANPSWVAAGGIRAALDNVLGVEDRPEQLVERLRVERESDTEAVVVGKGTRYSYRVCLKRLIKGPRGIWTATRVEYAPL